MGMKINVAPHQGKIRLHIEEPGPEPDLVRTKDLDLPLVSALMLAAQVNAAAAQLLHGALQKRANQAENKPESSPPQPTPDADGVL